MNARLGRQAKDFVKLVHKLRANHRHPDALIVQMGNNGPLYSDDMAAFHHYSRGLGHLFLINDEAPVSWEGQSNSALLDAAKEWPHTSLINWHAIAGRGGYTWDGIHLTPKGAHAYAKLVAHDVLRRLGAAKPRSRPAAAASRPQEPKPRSRRAAAASRPREPKPRRREARRRAAHAARNGADRHRRASPRSPARPDRRPARRRSARA
jgi:hypothetical protein